jgi:cytochrome oxidase Cu insertion factor (SCO1/SenC/PrrC family)
MMLTMNASKKSFLLIVAVFVAPILLGTLYFFNMERFGISRKRINYGTLVQPAFPLKTAGLRSGKVVDPQQTILKKWTLLYIAPSHCDQTCREKLLLIKRVRLLMNEQMRRVRTLLVADSKMLDEIKKQTSQQNPDLVYASVVGGANAATATSPFLAQFPQRDKKPVYLIDPLGNLMMVYAQDKPDAKKMIRDMSRLLKYSRLG